MIDLPRLDSVWKGSLLSAWNRGISRYTLSTRDDEVEEKILLNARRKHGTGDGQVWNPAEKLKLLAGKITKVSCSFLSSPLKHQSKYLHYANPYSSPVFRCLCLFCSIFRGLLNPRLITSTITRIYFIYSLSSNLFFLNSSSLCFVFSMKLVALQSIPLVSLQTAFYFNK